jgi:hypothetical protein
VKRLAGVIGITQQERTAARALEEMRSGGYVGVTTYSPLGSDVLLAAEALPSSSIRFSALAGGIAGLAGGIALTIGTTLEWPLITGGKPIVSAPAFFVIWFELTMLLAGLATFGAFLIHARAARRDNGAPYHPRFTSDSFGIFVPCSEEEAAQVERLLRSVGIEEVTFERS